MAATTDDGKTPKRAGGRPRLDATVDLANAGAAIAAIVPLRHGVYRILWLFECSRHRLSFEDRFAV